MIEIRNLKKYFGNTLILDIKNLKLPNNGLFFICGDSGCGKSTLLNVLAGFDKDFQGLYLYNNKKALPNNIGYINQKNILFASETVEDNILYFEKNRKNIDNILKKYHLSLLIKNKKASQLSGGEKARVSLIMNIAKNPDILLCDEVTAGLDEENAKLVFDILKLESEKRLVICVTHDVNLAKKYTDNILYIKDGVITNKISISSNKKASYNSPKKKFFTTKILSSMAKHKLKSKKIRTSLCTTLLSIGLVSFCLSILISTAIKDNLHNIFATFLNKDSVVMQNRNNTKNEMVDFSYLDYEDILHDYPEYFTSISAYYLNNIDSLFDVNKVYLMNNSERFLLVNFSLFSINDYELIDEELANDEIILGINDIMLRNFGLFLKEKFLSIDDLNTYMKSHDLFYEMNVEKKEWQYKDKVMFKIKSFVDSEKPTIYHSNSLFNEYILEELMRFKNKETSIKDLPWILNKQYYLNAIDGKSFLKYSEQSEYFEKKIPAYFLDSFNKITFKFSNTRNISLGKINYILQGLSIKEMRFGNDTTYTIIPESMVSGFNRDFLLSKNEKILNEVSELNSCININDYPHYPHDVAHGSITNMDDNSFNFSSNIPLEWKSNLKENEVVLSSALANMLQVNENDIIYTSFLHHSEIKENKMYNFYNYASLKVKHIKKDTNKYIYQDSIWINDFFRDYLGVSNYDLLVKNIEIQLNNENVEEKILWLNKNYSEFEFFNATGDLTKTIDNVLKIVEIVLMIFSLFTIVLSIIMFILVIYLFMQENINDFIAIYVFGGTNKDVKKFKGLYIFYLLEKAILSTIISILTIVIIFKLTKNSFLNVSIMNIAQLFVKIIPLLAVISLILLSYIQFFAKKEEKIAKFISFYK